jgi:hypothetical protein
MLVLLVAAAKILEVKVGHLWTKFTCLTQPTCLVSMSALVDGDVFVD